MTTMKVLLLAEPEIAELQKLTQDLHARGGIGKAFSDRLRVALEKGQLLDMVTEPVLVCLDEAGNPCPATKH